MNKHALIVSLAPFKFGTRARKAALAFVSSGADKVSYLAPARIGRTGQWDQAGAWESGGVSIFQVECVEPHTEPNFRTQIRNLMVSYIPALFRLLMHAARTPADLIFINGPTLVGVGLVHKLIHKSTLVLDIPERPGVLSAKGSLASLTGRVDKLVLKLASRYIDMATVVTYADVSTLQELGYQDVKLVRNVPLASWRAEYRDPPIAELDTTLPGLEFLAMGSIFEGRGYEMLIKAVSIVSEKFPLRLTICGPARESYRDQLIALSRDLGIESSIVFASPVPSGFVSQVYMRADVGMVLYESNDLGNDGLSNKLFECVSSGRPVIASRLPENRRFVESAKVGWLAETSVQGIADALTEAHANGRIVELSRHCRLIGERELNWAREFECVSRLLH
jgi:glycosyltransferase involved in cell wall biosynthesis